MDILNNLIADETNITGTSYSSLGAIMSVGLNYLLGAGISISVITIILSGIKFMESRGDPKAADSAKNALTYSVVAFLLCGGALTIKTLVFNSIGVSNANLQNSVPTF